MDDSHVTGAIDRRSIEIVRFPHATPEEFQAQFDSAAVPSNPGCYLMRDTKGAVIYVGKAKSLRARIRSYINESDSRYTVRFLMSRVAHLDFLVTNNEKEALLLENSLIKHHRPRYNIRLKDDKTYVSVRVNLEHAFPRVTITRKRRKDGSRYFGPYPSASAVRDTLRLLQRVFPLRTCSDSVLNSRTRPCLYHQMKQCAAPCVGYISETEYREIVEQVLLILAGRNQELETRLLGAIAQCAEKLEFEKAAALRDRLYAVRKTMERQRTVAVPGAEDRDVFGLYVQGRFSEIQVLYFRAGKMAGGRSFSFNLREMPLDELFGSFLLQYYADSPTIPAEVLAPVEMEDAETLAELLSEQRGTKVAVRCPQRGEKRALVDMANQNARTSFEEKRLGERANRDLLDQVQTTLGLARTPNRIECFDISTQQGDKPVGSMAVFENGAPAKNRYRKFAIKQVAGQDDFAMMREVLLRRYRRAVEENDLPDLVLIDGGKGQLNVAVTALRDLGLEDLDVASIAKARAQEGGRSPERFFIPGRANPIVPRQDSPVVHLLARVRDEAHRFAVTYHRKRRKTATLSTKLTEIPGVGEKRARLLLNRLGSLARIQDAPLEVIAALPGFSEASARRIKEHLAGDQTGTCAMGD
ncbi:MAG TPA: excinuclease ABC subunit UvrC [Candidatus Hydrogenedentes bacterium]|jgi:excinuclease ABC subunit C|nr:excinuclease ABC subunit UvrC [Candidatus Hydrogenedentota bacterium]MDY0031850.1 excinuclease ABC subunit UvrC [FCB group bacterium]NLT61057.1 excinuclease ABC subunit UvrC [Candidatus Hydrogenedentota bacterium]HNZ17703.1 excinuclease ABC subunit UvrC [Candidatus Hydrogenedentota bacterium]HOH35323.1 excinuclease ABC subunit UvrC [Candidatus Hydrogenedentota bacterium]